MGASHSEGVTSSLNPHPADQVAPNNYLKKGVAYAIVSKFAVCSHFAGLNLKHVKFIRHHNIFEGARSCFLGGSLQTSAIWSIGRNLHGKDLERSS